ncbi:hypothetical protein TTHERM_00498030 (macronuclear) [Tetrahymena thermophila SB210]|uniref:Uncharacterized protein n=1 Tax=Tetrahymena thermophila (strain SB210) TaxID=312017 RepID=I7MB67_TETTS|nr:hypothetical protein TTHERM_00498030 [Tetrahymena thermophila SB210]EAS07749.1 hypothetical protein TTHERM_00498030 [Tetrahymena thermophila SB210]|eukprot:XP_001027991.1 hypothetical protein TTHERM_00498030 [Tetrahymena thermophila SB210]
MQHEIEEIILHNILTLERQSVKSKRGNRNLLNKWFQDSIKSYFMQKVAAHLLMAPLNLSSIEEVNNYIHSNISDKYPQYIGVIVKYFEVIRECNIEKEFNRNLVIEMYSLEDCISSEKRTDYNINKKIRSSFVSYLLYNFFLYYIFNQDMKCINDFFEIWNMSFPENQLLAKRRRTQPQKKRVKIQDESFDYSEERSSDF